jgi:hypothetical protein
MKYLPSRDSFKEGISQDTATESIQASNFATITHHEIRAGAEALNPIVFRV